MFRRTHISWSRALCHVYATTDNIVAFVAKATLCTFNAFSHAFTKKVMLANTLYQSLVDYTFSLIAAI